MSVASEFAQQWREEIESLQRSLPLCESGNMRMTANGVDVTSEHILLIKRMIENLERAISIVEARAEG